MSRKKDAFYRAGLITLVFTLLFYMVTITIKQNEFRYQYTRVNDQHIVVLDTCTGEGWYRWVSPYESPEKDFEKEVVPFEVSYLVCRTGRFTVQALNDITFVVFDAKTAELFSKFLLPEGDYTESETWVQFDVR